MRRRGFTLIELLVVIAIIAILAAILFPVFARAREAARQSSCLSNTKQLALGVMSYTQDYDEQLPRSYDAGAPARGWFDVIQPYVKNNQVFYCPSDSIHNKTVAPSFGNISYGWNYYWLTLLGGSVAYGSAGAGLAAIQSPAETVVLADSGMPSNVLPYVVYPWYAGYFPVPIHNTGANVNFADGHSKWMKAPVPPATQEGQLVTASPNSTLWDLQ